MACIAKPWRSLFHCCPKQLKTLTVALGDMFLHNKPTYCSGAPEAVPKYTLYSGLQRVAVLKVFF